MSDEFLPIGVMLGAYDRKAIVEAMARAIYELDCEFSGGGNEPPDDDAPLPPECVDAAEAALTALSLALDAQGFACPSDRCPIAPLLAKNGD
jgi:hypothetical protein